MVSVSFVRRRYKPPPSYEGKPSIRWGSIVSLREYASTFVPIRRRALHKSFPHRTGDNSKIRLGRGYLRDGSPSPMRGKSLTCRARYHPIWRAPTARKRSETNSGKSRVRQVKDLPRIGVAEP